MKVSRKYYIDLARKRFIQQVKWLLISLGIIKKDFVDENKIIVSDKNRIIYFPLAKCGCSSVKKAMFKSELNLEISYIKDIHVVDDKKSSMIRSSVTDDISEYRKVVVVRNPFSRFVSFYVDKFLEYNTGKYNGARLEFGYHEYLNGVFRSNMSFGEVVDIACQIPDKLAERHFQSQLFGVNIYNVRHDECDVLKLEDTDVLNDYLLNNIDGFKILTRENRSSEIDWRTFYCEKTLQLIYERYKKDIVSLGYYESYLELKEFIESR